MQVAGQKVKLLASMPFGIGVVAVCCLYFLLMYSIPENISIFIRIFLLSLLFLNLLLCISGRCGSLIKNITVWKAGSILLHAGIALVIAAGFMSVQRHSVHIQVKENESVDLTSIGIPITIKPKDIKVERYPGGGVKQYITSIDIIEQGRVVETRELSVNHPLSYKGIKVYQSTFEETTGGSISGLTIKTEPGLPFAWAGLAFLGAGSLLMSIWRK